ncbi:MAG: peroxide stress protein YaaA [Rhizobiales bacterium TMED168]|nr:MAG: peroxide stress protein YaaA [Rhizobiales bacterium TMED168]|tara:strand:- start:11352 stop:12119 length:768 start_codon:yes stop_codon:yes gene_type:complete
MIILLSPAKTLDYEKLETNTLYTIPLLLEKSKILINDLKKKKPSEISKLMNISDKLSSLNSERYKSWKGLKEKSKNSKEAIFVFKGDVYQGLDIESFEKKDLEYSQNHLRLISGLYGLLKPLDIIEPYRLEMGTKLKTSKGKNLYEFWDKEISDQLVKDLESLKSNTIINLASNEYFNSVKVLEKTTNVISPVFKDFSKDKYKIISFYAKKARGLMAAWILKNKIKKEKIRDFNIDGYYYSKEDSSENSPVFLRD